MFPRVFGHVPQGLLNVPVNAFKLKAVFVKCLSLLIRDSLFVVSHRLPVTSLGHQLPELLRNVLKNREEWLESFGLLRL